MAFEDIDALKLEAEGYKNANAALVDRVKDLESRGDNARIQELETALSGLNSTMQGLTNTINRLAEENAELKHYNTLLRRHNQQIDNVHYALSVIQEYVTTTKARDYD